jgi:hypothetical protein
MSASPLSEIAKRTLLSLAALLCLLLPASAQETGSLPAIEAVQLGFKPVAEGAPTPTHKVGLWAPLSLRVSATDTAGQLVVTSEDSEDHPTVLRQSAGAGSARTMVSYVKPGRKISDIRLFWETQGSPVRRSATRSLPPSTGDLNSYLYLCLGAKLADLPTALVGKELKAKEEGALRNFVADRFALYEDDPARLPDRAIGYESIDLAILCTGDASFLQGMLDQGRGPALLRWVADGGRLVISLQPEALGLVERLLRSADGPPVPVLPSPGEPVVAKSLVPVEAWAGLRDKPFPGRGQKPVAIVRLDRAKAPPGVWDVQAQIAGPSAADTMIPVIARMPYGFGSITYVAFALDAPPFSTWAGRGEFLRTLADQIGPRYAPPEYVREQAWRPETQAPDLATQLHLALDNFDVPMVGFGYVALFILLYLLLIGPIDYFVLRRFFGKLEWTWLTFPLIVVGVSLAAYWGLTAESDPKLLVNQIDVVDYDLRSGGGTGANGDPAYARGTTFFAIRSPRIEQLDIGLANRLCERPRIGHIDVGQSMRVNERDDKRFVLSWFGRPDPGPAGMGRSGSQALARKAYTMQPDLPSLGGVPFAYRGSKSFVGTWHAWNAGGAVPAEVRVPLSADLVYHPRERPYKLTGTLINNGPDLVEANLFVFDRVYRLDGGLKSGEKHPIAIREIENGILPSEWKEQSSATAPTHAAGTYDPSAPLRFLLFHERLDPQLQRHNHSFRDLDWSWRLREDPRVINVPLSALGVREAILIARRAAGGEPALEPWLRPAGLPDASPLPYSATRDTYERFVLPLRPQP